MANFTRRDIFYVLVIISAIWFLVLMVQLGKYSNNVLTASIVFAVVGNLPCDLLLELTERDELAHRLSIEINVLPVAFLHCIVYCRSFRIENCKDGIGGNKNSRAMNVLKRSLDAKEREITLLRRQLSNANLRHHVPGLPTLYIITPTYSRPVQVSVNVAMDNLFNFEPSILSLVWSHDLFFFLES